MRLARVLAILAAVTFIGTGHIVSGHTFKHVAPAIAPAVMAAWIVRRNSGDDFSTS
jgi:uncharacterized membrane protein